MRKALLSSLFRLYSATWYPFGNEIAVCSLLVPWQITNPPLPGEASFTGYRGSLLVIPLFTRKLKGQHN